ncbi:hypothetical protein [Pseudomonas libanensis]|uniref:hypothetical protein n=1 Tax=Pseudomonas libanensis TaxID=75588 RepID=UPI0012E3ACC8|nr:hypothetical protein [Pseudomonas libanensis]
MAVAPGQRGAVGGAAVQNALLNADVAGARAAFDSLSGEIHASTASAMLEDSRYRRLPRLTRKAEECTHNFFRNAVS